MKKLTEEQLVNLSIAAARASLQAFFGADTYGDMSDNKDRKKAVKAVYQVLAQYIPVADISDKPAIKHLNGLSRCYYCKTQMDGNYCDYCSMDYSKGGS